MDRANTQEAKRLCEMCPKKEPCLDYALSEGFDYGIWGGLTTRERRRIKKSKRGLRREQMLSAAS